MSLDAGAGVFAQDRSFVQFIAEDLDDAGSCRLVEDTLKAHTGWMNIRAEHVEDNVLAVFPGELMWSSADFSEWLAPLGIHVRCFRTGVVGQDEIRRLSRACMDEREPQR